MQCHEVKNHFADYVTDSLDGSVQRAMNHHLAECVSCRAELDALTDVWVKLGTLRPGEPFSPDMDVRFHIAIDEHKRALRQGSKHPLWKSRAAIVLSASVLVLGYFVQLQMRRTTEKEIRAVVESADGGLFYVSGLKTLRAGDRIQTDASVQTDGGVGTVLAMADGSRIEMRAKTTLWLQRATDGARIHLDSGGVIVSAAKQRTGHLYVQTKDLNIAVVGTVFMVNTEEAGSRVAVIEGEVLVQQGTIAKKLNPGQQVATNPSISLLPVREEISWSRHAEEHLALLQQSAVPESIVKQPAQPSQFSAVSIKPLPDGILTSGGSLGFACHGVDGTTRAAFGGEISPPLGRCVGNGVTLAQLMNYAYQSPWRYGPNVPDWAQKISGDRNQRPLRFQIEAAADDPSMVTTTELRQMLQTMLADRFKLKVHRETQEVQGYALVIAKNGPKLKEASGELEPPHRSELRIQGKSSLDDLSQYLTQFVIAFANLGSLDGPFVNKTGLSGVYEYEFRISPAGGVRGETPAAGPPTRSDRAAATVDAISDGMEAQIGLRLQLAKMPADVIVIDQVDKPSPN